MSALSNARSEEKGNSLIHPSMLRPAPPSAPASLSSHPNTSRNKVCWQPIQHRLLDTSHPPDSDILFHSAQHLMGEEERNNMNTELEGPSPGVLLDRDLRMPEPWNHIMLIILFFMNIQILIQRIQITCKPLIMHFWWSNISVNLRLWSCCPAEWLLYTQYVRFVYILL